MARRTWWIILEEDLKAPRPERRFTYFVRKNTKTQPLFWNELGEAADFFQKYETAYWNQIEQARQVNPNDPALQIDRFSKTWKTYAARVKCLPNSKFLNQNFINKHILEVKEFVYEKDEQADGYDMYLGSLADGYGLDGYSDDVGYVY